MPYKILKRAVAPIPSELPAWPHPAWKLINPDIKFNEEEKKRTEYKRGEKKRKERNGDRIVCYLMLLSCILNEICYSLQRECLSRSAWLFPLDLTTTRRGQACLPVLIKISLLKRKRVMKRKQKYTLQGNSSYSNVFKVTKVQALVAWVPADTTWTVKLCHSSITVHKAFNGARQRGDLLCLMCQHRLKVS